MLIDKIQLEPDETIVIQTRRHWFYIAAGLAPTILGACVPLILVPFLIWWMPHYATASYGLTLDSYMYEIVFASLVWMFFFWIAGWNTWTNYYLDILTVTDRRVILVNQRGLFRRTTSSFRIERMQDIEVEVDGLLATLLDFGSLSLETAGQSEERFHAAMMPRPRDLKAAILEVVDKRM